MSKDELFDVCDILGMTSIFNKEETNNSINLKEAEKDLIKESLNIDNIDFNDKSELLSYNPVNEYNDIIKSLDNKDIDIDDNISNNSVISYDDIIHNNDNNESNNISIDAKQPYNDNYHSSITEEQHNQKIVDSVLKFDNNKDDDFNFNIEDENKEDLKLTLLEKIDNLIEELEDDCVDLVKIPKVDFSSSLEQIEYVAKVLMLKANKNKYSNLADEIILTLSNGLEILFDGNREFLGVKPNLTGYSDVVKVKLRRVRNDTSQIVSNVVGKYEMSPLTMLLIEIIPSMFLHSRRQNSKKIDNLYNDLSDDISEIRKYS